MEVISIVGRSNSGKTTFIERLIPELKKKGYKVGVIKHSHHDISVDREGKDSWRHHQAGAEAVMVASPRKLSFVKQFSLEPNLDDLLVYFSDMDLLLTEGYKRGAKKKIEVFRKEAHSSPVCMGDATLIALVTNSHIGLDVPAFSLDDYKGVAVFIEQEYLRK